MPSAYLKQRVQEYRIEQAIKERELDRLLKLKLAMQCCLSDIGYAERFKQQSRTAFR